MSECVGTSFAVAKTLQEPCFAAAIHKSSLSYCTLQGPYRAARACVCVRRVIQKLTFSTISLTDSALPRVQQLRLHPLRASQEGCAKTGAASYILPRSLVFEKGCFQVYVLSCTIRNRLQVTQLGG